MSSKLRRVLGFAVGAAGVIVGVGAPYVTLLPAKAGNIVVAIAAAILAFNGQLVKNGHKDD